VNHVIETLEAVGPVVDVGACGVEDVEIDFVWVCGGGVRDRIYVAEGPDTEDFVASL